MVTTIYLVRHGEVHNPEGIIYGHLPGYRLSARGRLEVQTAATTLAAQQPFDALFTSPLERAQESAGLIGERLSLAPRIESHIAETDVSAFQGRPFDALPRPYMTEDGVSGIESAASIRARMITFVAAARRYERLVAVSHRDPIAVLLLHWMAADLSRIADLNIPTGSVQVAQLDGARVRLRGPAVD